MASAASLAENFVLLPISLALSRKACKSSPVAPETAATFDIAESKSEAVFTAAVPRAVTPAVTGRSFSPAPDILPPAFWRTCPASPILASSEFAFFASVSSLFSSFSVSTISRCKASYCCCEMSPFARAVFACSAAVFSVASLSFVAEMLSARSFCFCESSSVFFGSSFRSFSTSFSCDWVFLMFLFTPSKALDSLVVSPPISTVMPLILFATVVHLTFLKNVIQTLAICIK